MTLLNRNTPTPTDAAALPTVAVLPTTAPAEAQPTVAQSDRPQAPPAPASPPLYETTEMSVADAQANYDANPRDPAAALTLFRAQLAAGDQQAAANTMRQGTPLADSLAIYMLSASAAARAAGDSSVALVILRDGYNVVNGTPDFPMYREQAGQQLYAAALAPATVNLFDSLPDGPPARPGADRNANTTPSPIFNAIRARALLTGNLTRLAEASVTAALRRHAEYAGSAADRG